MTSNKRQTLYQLPEYRILDAKRKKLLSFHLLDGVAFSRGCTMLTLNKTREAKRPDVQACLAAFGRVMDPGGNASLYETARRLELMWYGWKETADPNFATINLPYRGIFITPDGKPVDADGLPVPAPQPPAPRTPPEALKDAIPCSGCRKTIPAGTSRTFRCQSTVCGHCLHVWDHTGVMPAGTDDPNLTRVEPRWGLNVVTVPDYVAPLPEVPRG